MTRRDDHRGAVPRDGVAASRDLERHRSGWVGTLVLKRAGVVGTRAPGRVVRVATWIVVCFLGVNTLTNLAGRHPVERYGMTLVSVGTLVLAAFVARSEARHSSRT